MYAEETHCFGCTCMLLTCLEALALPVCGVGLGLFGSLRHWCVALGWDGLDLYAVSFSGWHLLTNN